MADIPTRIKHWADANPDKEVFIFFDEGGRTTTFTALEIYRLAGRFAGRLREFGFKNGDVISNALLNCPERLISDLGVIMAGGIASNLQAMTKDGADLWKAMESYKSAGIILPRHDNNSPYNLFKPYLPSSEMSTSSRCAEVTIEKAPTVRRILLVDRCTNLDANDKPQLSFIDDLRQSSEEIFVCPDISPQAEAFIFPTSGSTGYAKLVPRTHENVLKIADFHQNAPPSKRISPNQLGYMGAFPFIFLGNCTTSVIQDCFEGQHKIDTQRYWDFVEEENCDVGFYFPSAVDDMANHFKRNQSTPRKKFKLLITGGQPLTKTTISNALEYLAEKVMISFASTELWVASSCFITSPDQMKDFMTGRPWKGIDVRIVDEHFQDVETGSEGLVLIKSPFGVNHYYNQTPTKPLCTTDGYIITGDRGWFDGDGILYVSDRSDDVIRNGPLNIYPSWPESVLAKIPGVVEAVVIGIPQEGGAEKLCGCIVLDKDCVLTKADITKSYNNQFINTRDVFFPSLAYVEIMDSFPRTPTSKVNKKKLRQHLIDNNIVG